MSDEKPYCRGSNTIFRKLPNNGAECVIDFRDPSLLPSVLFHLNGEYHDSQMFIRENLDLLRVQVASQAAQIERLRAALEYIGNRSASPWVQEACQSALAATADGEGKNGT